MKAEGIESREATREEGEEIQIVREVREISINVTDKVYGRGRLGKEELANGYDTNIQGADAIKQERNGQE